MRQSGSIAVVLAAGLLVWVGANAALGAAEARTKGPGARAGQKAGTSKQTSAGTETQAESFNTKVPAHDIDIILGRPTSDSVTLSILAYRDMEGLISYGATPKDRSTLLQKQRFEKGRPVEIVIRNLKPDTHYYYAFSEAAARGATLTPVVMEGIFHTRRAQGSAFTFTMTADPHLDQRTNTELYRRTLSNAAADRPDFHIDLGDTFMTEKHASREDALQQYLAQRYYFGELCHSAPLFLVLGNHDGESMRQFDGTAASLGVWANTTRKRYFPNPAPDAFYSGNAKADDFAGTLQDYYAWQWGDALFVVLDPYRFSARGRGNRDNWSISLGQEQYQWLRRTLEQSKAKYKFIFIHQLVGGLTNAGRGGVEAAGFFEWGGRNADGTDGFAAKRPGWQEPIHQLLVRNHVSAVFHGHDHLFAKQELDGIVYQEVPQPGSYANLRNGRAAEYGYVQGTILGGGGHLRVSVSADKVRVDYVWASQPDGQPAFSYTIPAR